MEEQDSIRVNQDAKRKISNKKYTESLGINKYSINRQHRLRMHYTTSELIT